MNENQYVYLSIDKTISIMNNIQFIKHPIKENDTIESVAQHFGITTNYLQLVHNLNVDVYDKIKNISRFCAYTINQWNKSHYHSYNH